MEILDRLKSELAGNVEGHTETQLAYFCVGSEAYNIWGAHRQALRELLARAKAYREIKRRADEAEEGFEKALAERDLARCESEGQYLLALFDHYDQVLSRLSGRERAGLEQQYWTLKLLSAAARESALLNNPTPILARLNEPGVLQFVRSTLGEDAPPIKPGAPASLVAWCKSFVQICDGAIPPEMTPKAAIEGQPFKEFASDAAGFIECTAESD